MPNINQKLNKGSKPISISENWKNDLFKQVKYKPNGDTTIVGYLFIDCNINYVMVY